MLYNLVTDTDIQNLLNNAEPAIILGAHINNLPYMPVVPSIAAYSLLRTSWRHFMREYTEAVTIASESGANFVFID
jgi:hypothetical protein